MIPNEAGAARKTTPKTDTGRKLSSNDGAVNTFDLSTIKTAMVSNVKTIEPRIVPLSYVLQGIRGTRYASQLTKLRELRSRDRDAYDAAKLKLPAFCVSGTCATRDRK